MHKTVPKIFIQLKARFIISWKLWDRTTRLAVYHIKKPWLVMTATIFCFVLFLLSTYIVCHLRPKMSFKRLIIQILISKPVPKLYYFSYINCILAYKAYSNNRFVELWVPVEITSVNFWQCIYLRQFLYLFVLSWTGGNGYWIRFLLDAIYNIRYYKVTKKRSVRFFH